MPEISQRELRNDSAKILRRVEAGETFTITRRGVPVADLVSHRAHTRSGPEREVAAERIVAALAELPAWGVQNFEVEQRELDEHVDDEPRDPWAVR